MGISSLIDLGESKKEKKHDNLAQFLTDKGAVLYGSDTCFYCSSQIKLFGDTFDEINYVNCSKDGQSCLEKRIFAVPTWEIGGKMYPGLQSLERLAEIVGYEGPLK